MIACVTARLRSNTRWLCKYTLLFCIVFATTACAANPQTRFSVKSTQGSVLDVVALATFNQPWAMTFLPTGELLVSEKAGRLWLINAKPGGAVDALVGASSDDLEKLEVSGLPQIQSRGQGGLGDIILHPDFASNSQIYLSYVERDGDVSGAAVLKATLALNTNGGPSLIDSEIIWQQVPKVTGAGHYGHKLAFSADGYLFITSGERQKFDPAQNMDMNLGKIIRLHDDGRIPDDNPWFDRGGVAKEFWTIGHRNPLGIAFSEDNQLWVHEMGPRGGDELNRIVAGENYGYPIVSNGRHYNGVPIPNHDTRPEFKAPEITWNPVISPSSFIIYKGEKYPQWQGSGLIGGLSSQSLVRISLTVPVAEIERFDMNRRIREVEEDAEGSVYLLEDRQGGRLLRLSASS